MINKMRKGAERLIEEAFTSLISNNNYEALSEKDDTVIMNFVLLMTLGGADLDDEYSLFDAHMLEYMDKEYIPSSEAAYLIKTLYDLWRIWGSAYELRRGKSSIEPNADILNDYYLEYKH